MKKLNPITVRDMAKGKTAYSQKELKPFTNTNHHEVLKLISDGENFCYVEKALLENDLVILSQSKRDFVSDITPLLNKEERTVECQLHNLEQDKAGWFYVNDNRVRGRIKGVYNYYKKQFLVMQLISGTVLLMKVVDNTIPVLKQSIYEGCE